MPAKIEEEGRRKKETNNKFYIARKNADAVKSFAGNVTQ